MALRFIQRHRMAQTIVEYAILTAISLVAVLGMSSYLSRIKRRSAIKDHFDRVVRHIKGR